MSRGTLPRSLDVRKAAQRGLRMGARLSPAELPRLRATLAGDEGVIDADIVCGRDEQQHVVLDVEVSASLNVSCERCLQPFIAEVRGHSRLAAVWTDDQARALPGDLDPLVVVDTVDLHDVVEDELVLAMPMFSYHADPGCLAVLDADAALAETAEQNDRDAASEHDAAGNPFGVLATLRRSSQDPAGD